MQKKKIDNYIIYMDKKIGEGSFGKVYIGEQDKTHLKVAVKMLDKKTIDKDNYIKQALLSQIEILKILKSENIVGFLDVMESANYYYVIQEFCDGGDLRGLMKNRDKIPEKEAIEILKQICNGFVEILKQGIIHRDLKPQNILINKGVIKICDFGFSKKIHSKKFKNQTMVGTPLYMSLQILKGQPYTSKCDIWALGFIFYELLNGVTPYTANTQYELINNIQKKPVKFLVDVSPVTKDFLMKCLKGKQADRISWDQLLRHEIFKGYFSQYFNHEYEFENKLKSLMNEIRVKINEQNIDLERLFKNMGYNKQTELTFQNFQQFLKTIDSTLTPEQQRYIFQKLDIDESDTISLDQLQKQMIKNNIPMKSKISYEKKHSFNYDQEEESPEKKLKDLTHSKVLAAFVRLSQKMQKNKISLQQVFDAYDVNKDGDMSIKEFSRIMKKLDQSFTNQELKLAFEFVDIDGSGQITFQQFEKFYCKSTGVPYKNYMKALDKKQSIHSNGNSNNGSESTIKSQKIINNKLSKQLSGSKN